MNLDLFLVEDDVSIIDAMKKINSNNEGVVFLCSQGKLAACVTDGDIRRYLLEGGVLSGNLSAIANYQPIFLEESESCMAEKIMQEYAITAVPVINKAGEVVDICFQRKFHTEKKEELPQLAIPLVIMAGGKGTRLRPYTDILPKPLIPVDDKTITEHIMDQFSAYGCRDVIMIVNYKKEFIKAYFNDSETGRNIRFIEEQEYMGTGGGLKLLENSIQETFFMSNCDILVNADYDKILQYHQESGNIITLVCARKRFEVPYGTVRTDEDGQVTQMQEKPGFEYHVNTGLYVIEPAFLEKIPENTFIHITDMIETCIKDNDKVGAYLIDGDDWMDMGQMDELGKMKEYYLQGGKHASK